MSKLLRNRWLQRTLFAGVLIALGVGIYRVTPPEAMCEIRARTMPRHFADDGRKLVTFPMEHRVVEGLLQVWDTRTGSEVARFFEKPGNESFHSPRFSNDGRFFAAEGTIGEGHKFTEHTLHLIDMDAGTDHSIPLPDGGIGYCFFSFNGDLVFRYLSDTDAEGVRIYDTANGRLVDELPKAFLQNQISKEALFYQFASKTRRNNLGIWSMRERKTVAVIKDIATNPGILHARDGHRSVFERAQSAGQTSHTYLVWNARAQRVDGEFQSELHEWRMMSEDGRWLVLSGRDNQGRRVEIRELPSGRSHGIHRLGQLEWMVFSPDSKFLGVLTSGPPQKLTILEIPTLKTLWTTPFAAQRFCFAPHAHTVFVRSTDWPDLLALDCATGQVRARIGFVPFFAKMPNILKLSKDGRSLTVHRPDGPGIMKTLAERIPWIERLFNHKTDANVVIDTETCGERFRLHGWNTSSALLSDDGNILVTVHDESDGSRTLRCWDVNAWKPLHWTIGVPAGLGVLGVLLAWRRRRRQKGPNAA